MPSIFGVVTNNGAVRVPQLLSRVMDIAPNGPGHVWEQRLSPTCGLAVTRRTPQGGIAHQREMWLAFSGQIVEDEDFRSRLAYLPGEVPAGFCQRLLALYTCLGLPGLQALNGQYALAVWDEARQRLLLINDRLGLQPLYYWRGPHELVFSSQMKAIAAHPAFQRQVNPVALVDLLATGQMLGEHSLYAGVQALPPATRLTFEAGHLSLETYTQLPFYRPGRPAPTRDEAIAGLGERLQAAVARRVDQDTRLLLSGGLDSRLLAGFLGELKDGPRRTASTIGLINSRDVAIGRAAAAQAGLTHHLVPANPGYLRDYSAECVERTEGNLNVHAAWIFGEEEDLRVNPVDAIMTGAGGAGISGRHVLFEQPFTNPRQALDWLCNHHWQYTQMAGLLRPELRPAVEESRADLARALPGGPPELFASRLDALYFRQMRRRPSGNLLDAVTTVQEPYFDNDLVDYALNLPPAMRTGGRLMSAVLAQRFPSLAGLASTGGQARAPMLLRLWRHMRRRVGRTLFFLRPGPLGDDPTRAILYNHWMRNAARPFVTSLLTRSDLLGDFVDMREVRRMLDEHMTGRSNGYRLLGALVTFAEWRKQFM